MTALSGSGGLDCVISLGTAQVVTLTSCCASCLFVCESLQFLIVIQLLHESSALVVITMVVIHCTQPVVSFSAQQESRAWTIKAGMTAPQAAGVIHTDFERGFIRAETVSEGAYYSRHCLAASLRVEG